jgi:4-hydroxybenzoate polyprenyltransferase
MRLDRPIGIALFFLPCLFGIALAAKQLTEVKLGSTIFLFFIGAILMRSAGCVMNDLFDQKIDAKVARTKSRPLAAKEVTVHQALILLAVLLFLSFLILLQFNIKTIFAGCVALVLVVLYPLMKRITYYPQIFLGLVFNFGLLMASLAILQKIDLDVALFYIAIILWTVIYDTIYAYQDIEDDMKIGVKSTAVRFGKNPKKILLTLSLLMFVLLLFVGWKREFQPTYFLTILVADLFLNQKIQNCDFQNSQNCLAVFKANFWFGVLILIATLLG